MILELALFMLTVVPGTLGGGAGGWVRSVRGHLLHPG